MLALALMAVAAPSAAGMSTDSRNTDLPNTDTHFRASAPGALAEWESRSRKLRDQILFAAGLMPFPERTPLNSEVFGRIERPGYTIEKVLLRTLPGYYLGGNLYRPAGAGPFPAVLKPHGHWSYGRLEQQQLGSGQSLAANLARLGFVVFAYDMVGYNDTYQLPHRFTGNREALWGFGPFGLQLWNSIRALDFVASLPDVDQSRLAVTGASGGGTQTFFLGAVDDRVALTAPVNMVSAIMQGGCVCENAPGLRVGAYNVDFSAMMGPRPQLLVAATGDWTKNVPREEFPDIRRIYQLFGKPENIEAAQFDAPHNYHEDSRTAVYRFLARHLLDRGDAASITEVRVQIEQPRDLLAFYGRPLPADAVDYPGLFAWWRENARRQSEAVTDPEVARRLLRLAIKASFPARVEAAVDGAEIVLSRDRVGDRVPGRWYRQSEPASLILHPGGAEAACASRAARDRRAAGRSVLCLDLFQTGRATASRDRSHEHFLTFNLSDDANRIQDVLTGLAFLETGGHQDLELVGLDRAALWGVFAAAIAPRKVRFEADLSPFTGDDDELLDKCFVPGIQRAGGLAAARRLAVANR